MTIAVVLAGLRYLPASLGVKALQKVNPKFKNYFANAAAYGYDATKALEYLSGRFESDSQKDYKNQLDQGAANNTLRPDEAMSRSEMSNQSMPGKALRAGIGLLTGGLLGGIGDNGGSGSPAQVDESQAQSPQGMQPQQPISPQQPPGMGAAQPTASPGGQQPGTQGAPSGSRPAAQDLTMGNILAKYSHELDQATSFQIYTGRQAKDAATYLRSQPKFRKVIEKMEKDTGMSFQQIIEGIYGMQGASQGAPQGGQAQQGQQGGNRSQILQMGQNLAQQVAQLKKR